MKNLALAAFTLALISGAAFAQPHDDHHGGPAAHAPAPHGPAAPAPAARAPAGPAMQGHRDDHAGPAMVNRPVAAAPMRGNPSDGRPGPAMSSRPTAMRGNAPGGGRGAGGPGHHLPPGISAPRGHDRAPMWHGRSWAIGDLFYYGGFDGPTITDFDGYDLPPPRPGTHWIYVDGWFLMVGNRSGRIFAEVPADY